MNPNPGDGGGIAHDGMNLNRAGDGDGLRIQWDGQGSGVGS
jgi:hypothetical protein